MKTFAVVQARLGSTRLPAKVLLDLAGQTALQRCLDRVAKFRGLSGVVVATSSLREDDVIESLARRLGYDVARGSATDVLARYVDAARQVGADVVVRCTSDCPLLDPTLSSEVIAAFAASDVDYASNVLDRRLPRGLDTEVIRTTALERAAADARTSIEEREHVTKHLYANPDRYRLKSILPNVPKDLSHLRWTLDTLDDYRFLYAVYEALGSHASTAGLDEVMALLGARPELCALNAHVVQKR